MQSIILITGGNSGIGFELASQLLADKSKFILLGCRSAEKGEAAVKELQSRDLPGTVAFLQIDVSQEESVVKAAKEVESKYGRLDALVNNAGVGVPPGSFAQQLSTSFQTNATGPAIVVDEFAPLLKKSANTPRIVNVSTEMASIVMRLDEKSPTYAQTSNFYRVSKAALNMITACQSVEYGTSGRKVFAYCPGHTVSGFSEYNKAEYGAKPTSEGAGPIVSILNGKRDGEHGKFLHGKGVYPW